MQDCTGALKFHAWSGIVIFGLAGAGLAAGLVDLLFRPAADWWWRRLVRWCGTFIFLAIIATILLRGIPQLIWWARTSRVSRVGNATEFAHAAGSVGAATGWIALSLGHLVFRSGGSGGKGSLPKKLAKVPRKFRLILQKFLIGLVVPLSLLTFFLIAIDSGTRPWSKGATWVWVAVLAAVLAIFAVGNPIAWSAQPFYKRRLRSVFALKRDTNADGVVTVGPVAADQEPLLSDLRPKQWPQLLISAAANVSDLGYTPPGLGVTSFVFSPDHVGGPLVGSIPTDEYEKRLTRIRFFQKMWNWRHEKGRSTGRLRDVSPLSAVSISGAAVSPSMGRMNQPAYRMLIAMLNLRLGVWLANPRLVDELKARLDVQAARASDLPAARIARTEQPSPTSSSTSPTAGTTRTSASSNCCGGVARRSTRSMPPATRRAPSARSVRPSRWRAASSASSSTTSTRRSSPSRIAAEPGIVIADHAMSALHVPRRRRRRHADLHQEGARSKTRPRRPT